MAANKTKFKIGDKVTHKADVGVVFGFSEDQPVRKSVGLVVETDIRECYSNTQVFYSIRWTNYDAFKTAALSSGLIQHGESELELYVEPEQKK